MGEQRALRREGIGDESGCPAVPMMTARRVTDLPRSYHTHRRRGTLISRVPCGDVRNTRF